MNWHKTISCLDVACLTKYVK